MDARFKFLLDRYNCRTVYDYENALQEIIQEISLLGLWRAKFFEHAAFYGGTALRILYGLNRFSEDLDFSLLTPQDDFFMNPYSAAIQKELLAFGLESTVESKQKVKQSAIQSAFIKAGTKQQLLKISLNPDLLSMIKMIDRNQLIKIKLEIDVNPPGGFMTETHFALMPIPFSVLVYSKPDLFAGKLHACLARSWQTRVKGRDWYDFVWFVAQQTPVRINHLKNRLIQSGHLKKDAVFTRLELIEQMKRKINTVDWAAAKQDIMPFIQDSSELLLWSTDFFMQLTDKIKCI